MKMRHSVPADENATLVKMLHGVLHNQQVLAEACGVELPFSCDEMTTIINNDRDIKLPVRLQKTMLCASAFDMAVEEGYIKMKMDGHLEWMLGSSTLLAYFLGRLFAGDCSRYSNARGGKVWLTGKRTFPAKELQDLFGQKTLRKLRHNRDGRLLPEHFELVDELFQ